MPTIHLTDRALIDVIGPDAESFLQNVLTNDFGALAPGEARPGALLTPQGKVLFDYLVSRNGENGFVLECRADVADELVKRLMLYRLRAKADISKRDESLVAVSWDADSTALHDDPSAIADRRFSETRHVARVYQNYPAENATPGDWQNLRIADAVAESGSEYALGDAFPHEILFDQNGGVGLKKGCFVGQEVVSRMHHRGTARRRLLIVSGKGALPDAGTAITAGGWPLGTLGTVVGRNALAIIRIDRAKKAMDDATPILAGDVEVEPSIPAWAHFRFPERAADAHEA